LYQVEQLEHDTLYQVEQVEHDTLSFFGK